jgi:Rad3-related DNA helicase/serine/threonine protein kinase
MGDAGLQRIDHYTIIRLLNENPISSTYLGKEEQRKKRYVIIKVFKIPLSTTAARESFVSRAKQLKKLRRSNITELIGYGFVTYADQQQDYGYHAIEYIQDIVHIGESAPVHTFAPDQIKPLLSTIADTLQYAHVSQVLHGNLHPGNIFFGEELRITDFAPMPQEYLQPFNHLAKYGLLYKAPEHLRGTPTTASDQYSLAVIAYEWLCGQHPYTATTYEELLYQQEHEEIPSLHSMNNKISLKVEAIILKALSPDPAERFEHMLKFSDAYLRALMGFPLNLKSNITVKQSIQPTNDISRSQTHTPAKPAKDGHNTHDETIAELPDQREDAASNLHPHFSDFAIEPRIDATPEHKAQASGEDNVSNNINGAEESSRDKKQNTLEKSNRRKPSNQPVSNEFTHLHQIVTRDLGHGGILSERLQGYEERPAQIEMAALVARSLTEERHAIVEATTGTGKALDVDTPIPTPTGWKRMGDLEIGDCVFDEKGLPTRVTAAFDVMYHRTCYEVEFSDGSSIVADAEHEWASYTTVDRSWAKKQKASVYRDKNFITSDQLIMLDRLIDQSRDGDILTVRGAIDLIGGHQWSVFQAASQIVPVNEKERPMRYRRQTLLTATRNRLARDLFEQRRDGRTYTLVTTERIAATLKVGTVPRLNHAILVADPLNLPEATLPIDPYFLGIWLGDGSSYSNEITTADPDLISEIEKAEYTVRSLKSRPYRYAVDDENGKAVSRWQPGMTGRLRTLGLLLNKHIPAIYLRASERQRRALLAGLLDTDGTVSRHGVVEFTSTNPQLTQDVQELLCSLGFRPSLRGGRSRYNGKDCGPKWILSFTTNVSVFRLRRKVVAHKERLRNYSPERNRFRYIVAVREVPSRPVRCIQVDSSSHLYLAGKSMIPTHNSLAYLLPIVRSGKVAIISTANKALQEQLFYKDIPFVQEHIQDFEAALVKGMGNYICLDRMDKERIETQPLLKNPDFTRLLNIVNEFELNITGDFETLGFTLPGDIRARVNADSDQCAWRGCHFFPKCYVRQMRETAAQSQVIVVNHTLLLLDAALEGFLLPKREVIVVDEAHHLEEEATRAFTVTVSESKVLALLAQQRLKLHTQADLQEEAKQTMKFAWDRLDYITQTSPKKGRVILEEPIQEGLHLATIIAKLAQSLREQRPEYMEEPENSLYDKLLSRTDNLSEALRKVFSVDQRDTYVYYVERVTKSGRRSFNLEVNATPMGVHSLLKEYLFDKSKVISTSATLATVGANPIDLEDRGPNFAYFRKRIGLDYVEYPDVLEHILPYSFDYKNNALLYIPRHIPEPVYGPDSGYYTKKLAEEMMNLVEASQGRAFLLFSSKRMLDDVYNIFLDHLPTHLDFRLLRQGEMNRMELVREFRESEGAVLFGLKSFWEGVDIVGETLSLVVIDKMPFDPPDDPVHEARVAKMKANKENWFGNYVLPQAVLRLKQGLGRLLRTHEDRGVMAILDTRLYTKGYGKLVLNALPPARRTEHLVDVKLFFKNFDDAPF